MGLNERGFRRKLYDEILSDMESKAVSLFGDDVSLGTKTPLGMFLRVSAWTIGTVWQLVEKVYNSAFISTSEGVSLDRLVKNIGLYRRPASRSIGEVTFYGDNGTTITQGVLLTTDTGKTYRTTDYGTISGGQLTLSIESIDRGSIYNVTTGLINKTVNTIAGVNSVSNLSPTFNGLDTETDPELRSRYNLSLSKPGSSTVESIRATILAVEGVEECVVSQNNTMNELEGIPPKSIAPLVLGGTNEMVGKAIYSVKAAGIQSYGVTEVDVLDSLGNTHKIGFTRPTTVTVNVVATLSTTDQFPIDGTTQVGDKIKSYINSLSIGESVIFTKIIGVIQEVNGIVDIPVLTVNGVSTNLNITSNQIARHGTVSVT